MTADPEMIDVFRLTKIVRELERAQATGKQTILWEEYSQLMQFAPEAVTLEEAAWWLGAYLAQAFFPHQPKGQVAHEPAEGHYEAVLYHLHPGRVVWGETGQRMEKAAYEGWKWYVGFRRQQERERRQRWWPW